MKCGFDRWMENQLACQAPRFSASGREPHWQSVLSDIPQQLLLASVP